MEECNQRPERVGLHGLVMDFVRILVRRNRVFQGLFCVVGLWVNNGIFAADTADSLPAVDDLIREGVELVDEGKYDPAIERLKAALVHEPKSILARYELSYALYKAGRFSEAKRHLRRAMRHPDHSELVYQLLGNAYDQTGRTGKAIRFYRKGLERFPSAGNLHLEMGVVAANSGDWASALGWWERGVLVDSRHSSNYFWASKAMARAHEFGWALMYGEAFCNLERNTSRTMEMSIDLVSYYRHSVRMVKRGDARYTPTVRLSRTLPGPAAETSKSGMADPIALIHQLQGIMETALLLLLEERGDAEDHPLRLRDIHQWRAITLELLGTTLKDDVTGKGGARRHAVLAWWSALDDKGVFEAYNYWLLTFGDKAESSLWAKENTEQLEMLYEHLNEFSMPVDGVVYTSRLAGLERNVDQGIENKP